MRLLWVKKNQLLAILVTSLTLVLAGCSSYIPQDILSPNSPAAQETANLFYIVFWIAVVIFVIVEGALVYFVLRYQRRAQEEFPEQYHGNTRLEVTWTIIPALILVVVFAFTIRTMGQVGPTNPPNEGTKINVRGHQWWWEIQYNDSKVLTANELHMPAGQLMNLTLTSENVIHSFWVPRLMGKTDTVPSHENKTWLLSNDIGEYHGQCAEFCGAQHANMLFKVIVESPEQFQAWLANQAAPPVEPVPGSLQERGKQIITDPKYLCVGCHAIQGTNMVGVTGPNLTHFASRNCFAGCMFQSNQENLVLWLQNPQARKPGTLMKINQLTDEEINALTAYLESLR